MVPTTITATTETKTGTATSSSSIRNIEDCYYATERYDDYETHRMKHRIDRLLIIPLQCVQAI